MAKKSAELLTHLHISCISSATLSLVLTLTSCYHNICRPLFYCSNKGNIVAITYCSFYMYLPLLLLASLIIKNTPQLAESKLHHQHFYSMCLSSASISILI